MTASPYRHLLTRLLAIALTSIVLGAGAPARAQDQVQDRVKGEARVENANGFIRLVFRFDKPVPAQVKLAWPVMVIEFTAPVTVAVDKLNAAAPQLIGAARSDPDGKALRIALSQKVKAAGRTIVGVGTARATNRHWAASCHEFHFYEKLSRDAPPATTGPAAGFPEEP